MNLLDKLKLCWRILRQNPGGIMAHANRELPKEEDEMQRDMNQGIRELILVFGTHGHSGFSAGYAVNILASLLSYKPLGPLLGTGDEWMRVGPGVFQNKRCGHVFSQADRFDGQAYDLEGVVFYTWETDEAGVQYKNTYTNWESMTPIIFPYTPKTEYREVKTEVEIEGHPV